MASSREPVLAGVFASNQHKPFIRYGELEQADNESLILGSGAGSDNKLLALGSGASLPADLPDPEVMEVDEDPPVRPNPLPDWRVPYLHCLVREMLLVDKTKARWLARHAKSFVIIGEELYKNSHIGVLQRCIPSEQGKKPLDDIHCGSCGHHAGPRTLVGKAF
jgi:hypothetical protein